MPFTLPSRPVPAIIGEIQIDIFDLDGTNQNRSIRGMVQTLANDGQPSGNWNGDLIPHIPQEHAAALIAFLNWVRATAEDQLLP